MVRSEWVSAWAIALIATLVLQIPYALGYVLAPPETEYQGLLVNVEDFSYHAIMLQGYAGAWQYHIQFTPEEHAPAFIYGFYLALGHLARGLGISIVGMWHVARIMAALILFLAVYAFIAQFIQNLPARRVAFMLAILGAGFDWFLLPWEPFEMVGVAPIDFRMPEAHLFYSAMAYPHYSVGITLLLAVFYFATRAIEQDSFLFTLFSSFANLALVIVYPFLIYLTASVLGVNWLIACVRAKRIEWRAARHLFVGFVLPLPLILYDAFVLATNPIFRAWNAQATTLSPNPLHYLLAYGVMIALGAFPYFLTSGGKRMMESPSARSVSLVTRHPLVLWLWIFIVAVLLYAPLNAQRRFVEGVQIPLAILSTIGLVQIVLPRLETTQAFRALAARRGYSADGVRRLIVVLFLFGMSIANLVILMRLSFFTAVEQPDAFFRPRAEIAAVEWLRDHTSRTAVVLGAYWTGSFIPARAGNRVFVGQRYETLEFETKVVQAEKFFSAAGDDAWRRGLLAEYRIAYVFYGARERALGMFDPARAGYLREVFSNSVAQIFAVREAEGD